MSLLFNDTSNSKIYRLLPYEKQLIILFLSIKIQDE